MKCVIMEFAPQIFGAYESLVRKDNFSDNPPLNKNNDDESFVDLFKIWKIQINTSGSKWHIRVSSRHVSEHKFLQLQCLFLRLLKILLEHSSASMETACFNDLAAPFPMLTNCKTPQVKKK